MAWIKIIKEEEAEGPLARTYEALFKRSGRVHNILKIQSQSPSALKAFLDLYRAVMHGESPLSLRQREMLAVVVSKLNGCHY